MARMNQRESGQASSGKRNGREKLALVLAGGGITGATYEIGALQALDHAFGFEFSVTEFDMIIGLSAGSFVGSMLANGVTPAEMFFALQHENPFIQVIDQLDIFYPNYTEAISRSLSYPFKLVRNWFQDVWSPQEIDVYKYIDSLNELLPSGLFSNKRIESYLSSNLTGQGRVNDFRKLKRQLFVTATDLDTGERVIFGDEAHMTTPISKAVQASTALPLFYKPVTIDGREYIDGAIRKSVHIDVALSRGSDLVICINPLVPYYHDSARNKMRVLGGDGKHLSDKGMVSIAHQVMRIMVHSRISSGLEKYRAQFPHADILLIEPRRDDEKMFSYKLMNYPDRLDIARHGYQETLEALLNHFDQFSPQFLRHGIRLSRRRIRSALQEINELPPGSYDLVERLLYPRERYDNLADRLEGTLDSLDYHLMSGNRKRRGQRRPRHFPQEQTA